MQQRRNWWQQRRQEHTETAHEEGRSPALIVMTVYTLWVAAMPSVVWAQAAIDITQLNDWLNTMAWYFLVPFLRIAGGGLFVGGLVSFASGRLTGGVGSGFMALGAGGALLLVSAIVDTIYRGVTVGTQWATTPG
jgi:hypothetical protein